MTDRFRQNWMTWERLQSRRLLVHELWHDGLKRTALLYVPRHMRRRGALPLVLVFHGGNSTPQAIARASAMHRIAEREGFVVAYPAGVRSGSALTWRVEGGGTARSGEDARFVRTLIIDLLDRYDTDPARVFVAGFSIGGSLVYELACQSSYSIKAAAVVCASMAGTDCHPRRPLPLIHIHGLQDRRVPFAGGRGTATRRDGDWLPVQPGIDRWCEINGCTSAPQVVRHAIDGITGYRYNGAADVELWLVEGGRHAWPGGVAEPAAADDPVARPGGFSASEKIWSFFAAHSPVATPSRRRSAAAADVRVRLR